MLRRGSQRSRLDWRRKDSPTAEHIGRSLRFASAAEARRLLNLRPTKKEGWHFASPLLPVLCRHLPVTASTVTAAAKTMAASTKAASTTHAVSATKAAATTEAMTATKATATTSEAVTAAKPATATSEAMAAA